MQQPTGVITQPRGFRAAGVAAGIKKAAGRNDVALLVADEPASAAAVFTTNTVCAAPVRVSREHVAASRGRIRAIVVNSGNANACTGEQGMRDAKRMAALAAELIGDDPTRVLVGSTGIIGHPLPMTKVEAGIRQAAAELSADERGGRTFLEGIMTTDIFPKESIRRVKIGGRTLTVAGVVKGAGMMQPNMATMLSFLTTDAKVAPALLKGLLKEAVANSFNRITVDGHMSTNDTAAILAGGASGVEVKKGTAAFKTFANALGKVTLELALQIVRDGEGAKRIAAVRVIGAKSDADAEKAARLIANSPLVKCAIFGADPNWGRIVSGAGASGCALDERKTSLKINGHFIYRKGKPLPASDAVLQAMKGERVDFELDLGLGRGRSVVYACDLGHAYVDLNSAYST